MSKKTSLTLFDKVWNDHIVLRETKSAPAILYIDLHLIHEVTTPQAFTMLRENSLKVRKTKSTIGTMDHSTPTLPVKKFKDIEVAGADAANQVRQMITNCKEFNIELFDFDSTNRGIVHVIGPELGYTLPGMTIVCGDSHTSTHGALGCLAMGIGTSEVEHVLATQCLKVSKLKNMLVKFEGTPAENVSSKDIVLYFIGLIGTAGGTGYAIEFAGSYIENISIESRMTICNMAIEAGAKVGLVAPDKTTINYVREKSFLDNKTLEKAEAYWSTLKTDEEASFDNEINIDVSKIKPQVTWGTSPEMVVNYDDEIPTPLNVDKDKKKNIELARDYMGIQDESKLSDLVFDKVFIGSCTNSRIEDLRQAAEVVKGKTIADNIIEAIVVPGSGMVKEQAEMEGLDEVFKEAGFIWRDPGCSMCLGMNPDQLKPYERCASTSNRNFEGRQGYLGRTHLMSPLMAAYTAIKGTVGEPS